MPRECLQPTAEQADYIDYLRLISIAKRLELRLNTSPDSRRDLTPSFSYLGDITSLDSYVGLEHFHDFNNAACLSTAANTTSYFKESLGHPPNHGEALTLLAVKHSKKPSTYTDYRTRAIGRLLPEEFSDIEATVKASIRLSLMPQIADRSVINLPLPDSYLEQEQFMHKVPSVAETHAFANFAIKASYLIDNYSHDFGRIKSGYMNKAAHFCGALATQLTLQINHQ